MVTTQGGCPKRQAPFHNQQIPNRAREGEDQSSTGLRTARVNCEVCQTMSMFDESPGFSGESMTRSLEA